jgi:hypothetical protein
MADVRGKKHRQNMRKYCPWLFADVRVLTLSRRKQGFLGAVQIGIAAGHLLHGSRLRRPLRG